MKLVFYPALVILLSAIVSLGAAIAGGDNPYYHFDEFRFATYYNAAQIVACAVVAMLLFMQRKKEGAGVRAWFWMIVVTGSIFLAADELFSIHDYDGFFLTYLRNDLHIQLMQWPVLTENFYLGTEDFVLMAYGAFVVAMCAIYRSEFLSSKGTIFYWLAGTLVLILSCLLDFNVLMKVHHSLDTRGYNGDVLRAWEESFKLVGFACMLAGLIHRLVKNEGNRKNPI